ncbi:MAG: hypothetical protein C0490_13265, partial [Marivirga sp.]|nr:hypothetical protein [Marivirga sp.]
MFAQMIDDFSDGDFTSNPAWSGTNEKFIVTSQALKLQAPASTDIAYLTTEPGSLAYGNWEFLVGLDFNPSGTNYARIYLSSDQPDLSGPLNGYFVSVGGSSDDITLWKQTGTDFTRIIEGRPGLLDLPSLTVRIKVTFDESGMWKLFSDIGPSGSFFNEGSAMDPQYTASIYFGVYCSYTATRSDKFFFDDFAVNNIFTDVTPPEIKSLDVISSTQLRLTFSEPVDHETAGDISHYMVDNNHGGPSHILLESDKIVLLSFDQTFVNGIRYSLVISGIKDKAGNVIISGQKNFTFIETIPAALKDIIITEIFPDPSPTVWLPEIEFVEIFNRSKNPFDLKGWKITDGTSVSFLSNFIIQPGEYVIITSAATAYVSYGKVVEVSGFPSLNNSGDVVVIKDFNDVTVDSVCYTDNWYNDEERKSGGWTLELIDPENLCSESENWIISEHPDGGTPGNQNSVFSNKPDLTGPLLISAIPITSSLLQLTFNEKLDRNLPTANDFNLEPSIGIAEVSFSDASLTKLSLSLLREIQPALVYSVTAKMIYDCSGNSINTNVNHAEFGLPQTANQGDILINEILFNPRPLGNDFVEIVNVSSKFINLKNWSLANIQSGSPANTETITYDDFLLKPGGYLVLTEDIDVVMSDYPSLLVGNVLIVEDLPSLNDDVGSVLVGDESQQVIDSFRYTDDLHSIFIDDTEGVSLERISFSRPTNEDQNWKSASSAAGFATPGFFNSNGQVDFSLQDESVKIVPEIFVPVSGQPDFTQIHYKFEKGGYIANVTIFDPAGHLIKQIA